ncbi:NUDIX domain-containing protein [Schaalia sp. lx-100]|uniref:NUDIX domain-containing protein n=1 Tax=Schaalia sp. lx-100 TaxID=2899081 RepID=UPI001E4EC7C0|nr:NUDIX hydrolase [Schaalia sp. lx-100]MCD4556924.1 NUDIX hydrolase [Schaalia sp. lx-100]
MSENALKDVHEKRQVIARSHHWDGRIISVVEDHVLLKAGSKPVKREYVTHPGAVAVVALRGEAGKEEILMIRQYRHPVKAFLWEIPAGLLDCAGETPVEAAQRELAEETDLAADQWNVLVEYFNSPGCSTESVRIFLAQNLHTIQTGYVRTEEEAEAELRWVLLDDALRQCLEGNIHNPSAITGIMAAYAARSRCWADLREANAQWMR